MLMRRGTLSVKYAGGMAAPGLMMTVRMPLAALAVAAALFGFAGLPANASADPFIDLPGVSLPAQMPRSDVVCVQSYEEPRLGQSWRVERKMVYSCTRNGLTFESNRAPYSRDRDMRGIGW